MHKRKISNLHKIVLDFILFNFGSILANIFFESINFTNNKDNQENSIFKTFYKNNNQILEIRRKIEYKPMKKKWLTLKEKQTRMAQKKIAKL